MSYRDIPFAEGVQLPPPLTDEELRYLGEHDPGLDPGPDPIPLEPGELRIVTLDEFVAVEEPGAAAILGSPDSALIPEGGDVMMYGDGGVGKTTLTIDLACHLAAGDDWLGISVARAVRVLIVENEGPRPLFRRKLERKRDAWTGSPLGDRLQIFEHPWGRFTFAQNGWRQLLAEQIRERQVDVLVVGPLTSSGMDAAGTLQEVREFAAHVEQVRELSGRPIAIVIVHHENKAAKVSGAWEGVGDTLLHIQQQGHGRLRLYVQKSRWASEQHATTLQLVWAGGDGFALAEGEAPRPERVWDEIGEYVLEHGGCAWNAVDAAVSGQGDYKRRRRDQMLAEGVLVNSRTRARMELWHRDDPARPTLQSEIASVQGRDRDAVASVTGDGEAERDRVPASRRSRDAGGDAVVLPSPGGPESNDAGNGWQQEGERP
jgi:AAA domain